LNHETPERHENEGEEEWFERISLEIEWAICQTVVTCAALAAHVASVDPDLLNAPGLNAREIALIPRSPKGAHKPAVLVTAENGSSFTMIELLWHAHRLQRPFVKTPAGGIGFYRSGLAKNGVPSYLMDIAMHWAMAWHAEASETSAL